MRFSASFSDQGSIETFTRCLQAMVRMSKKRCAIRMSETGLCLIACPASGLPQNEGSEYWLGVLFPWMPTFQTHTFQGLSEDKNEIVLELDTEQFTHSLSGNHANTKMRLTNRDNTPHLKVDIRSHNVSHEIPVTMVQSKKWLMYARPFCEGEKAIITIPPAKTLLRVMSSMKNMHCKFVTVKASNTGDLHLQTAMKNGDITVFFSDLVNDRVDRPSQSDSQQHWSVAKLHVKPLQQFFSQFLFAHGRIKLSVLSERRVEFGLIQEDFEVSFVMGDNAAD